MDSQEARSAASPRSFEPAPPPPPDGKTPPRPRSSAASTHFGRDSWDGHRKQWFGPFGIGVERHEITLRFWLPSVSWVWGYWR